MACGCIGKSGCASAAQGTRCVVWLRAALCQASTSRRIQTAPAHQPSFHPVFPSPAAPWQSAESPQSSTSCYQTHFPQIALSLDVDPDLGEYPGTLAMARVPELLGALEDGPLWISVDIGNRCLVMPSQSPGNANSVVDEPTTRWRLLSVTPTLAYQRLRFLPSMIV